MKKILIVALCFFALNLKAQTLPKGYTKLITCRPSILQPDSVNIICVSIQEDNLINYAVFKYKLKYCIGDDLKTLVDVVEGSVIIQDDDYKNWDANDNTFPSKYVITKLGLTIKN